MTTKVTAKFAKKVLSIVDKGLSYGLFDKEPKKGRSALGHICVEHAVCLAEGRPGEDNPKCVATILRDLKIHLNNGWHFKNNKHRAKVLRRLAIAQLGTRSWSESKTELFKQRIVTLMQILVCRTACKLLDEEDKVAKGNHDLVIKFLGWHLRNGFEFDFFDIKILVECGKVLHPKNDPLMWAAEIYVEVLKNMNTPGSKFLYLTERKTKQAKTRRKHK